MKAAARATILIGLGVTLTGTFLPQFNYSSSSFWGGIGDSSSYDGSSGTAQSSLRSIQVFAAILILVTLISILIDAVASSNAFRGLACFGAGAVFAFFATTLIPILSSGSSSGVLGPGCWAEAGGSLLLLIGGIIGAFSLEQGGNQSAAAAAVTRPAVTSTQAARVQQGVTSRAPADWYSDPSGSPFDRYWDGAQWTQHTRPKSTS